jgi:hypothetical protein
LNGIQHILNKYSGNLTDENKGITMENGLSCLQLTSIYNNPLLNYLHQKPANVWLKQVTQIKSSLGVSPKKMTK